MAQCETRSVRDLFLRRFWPERLAALFYGVAEVFGEALGRRHGRIVCKPRHIHHGLQTTVYRSQPPAGVEGRPDNGRIPDRAESAGDERTTVSPSAAATAG